LVPARDWNAESEAAPMMFRDGNGGWCPWMGVLMVAATLTYWALISRGAVFLVRGSGSEGQGFVQPDPEHLMKEGFAPGEIDPEEFRRLRESVSTKE
jgi:uncharacterized membrane protein